MAIMNPGSIAYFNGAYVPLEEAKISIMTHAFNYGTGLFEGIRGYYSAEENNILVFRLPEHIDRLMRNCRIMCMDIPEDQAAIEEICLELIRRSRLGKVCISDLSFTKVNVHLARPSKACSPVYAATS